MTLKIISIGKKHEDWVASGIERYQKRLRGPFSLEWVLLPPSGLDEPRARQDESERIQKLLRPNDYVILLDERGVNIDSPALSTLITSHVNASRSIVIIIGGAYGIDQSLRERANYIWSLSNLVFPHQLVRLILAEQLYRAQEIENGGGYHHS